MEMNNRRISTDSDYKLYGKTKKETKETDTLLGLQRPTIPYPKSVFFIFVTEFCERFSYYGMRTVLTLYLRNALKYTDESATAIYHIFIMFCYLTPLLGAYIADSLLGKFRTILYLSIIYAIGNVTLSLSSATPIIPIPPIPFSLLGLGLIALGTGGIKPCVSAFGGDQFQLPEQEKSLEQYFFIFYFLVNSGSTISTFLTPVFRKDVSCFDTDTCYPLAFGVPAVLMITALVIFVAGKSFYKIRLPEKNVGVQIIKCIWHAICNRKSSNSMNTRHWLDNAIDEYDFDFIEDVKRLLSILVLFIPLPIFWSLFDQQGSQWTLQATRMNGYLFSGWSFKPDQMQVVNSFLVLLLIPLFEMFIYPMLAKCNLLKKPLQRMTLGGLLVSLSFVIAGIVELQIVPTYPIIPKHFESSLNFVNTLPCPLKISLMDANGNGQFDTSQQNILVEPFENIIYNALPAPINYSVSIEPYNQSESCLLNGHVLSYSTPFLLTPKSQQSLSILITVNNKYETTLIYSTQIGDDLKKSLEGNAKLRVLFTGLPTSGNMSSIILKSQQYNYVFNLNSSSSVTNTIEVEPGSYTVQLKRMNENETIEMIQLSEILPGSGGSYIIVVFPEIMKNSQNTTQSSSNDIKKMIMKLYTLTSANTVSMMLLLPQYIVITIGELLFAITGYNFSYSQAPNSMKTVMQSVWLLTNAFGNIIVVLVVESGLFTVQSTQFFLFAGLMFFAFVVFVFLAHRYESIEIQPSSPLFIRKSALPPMNDFYDTEE